MLIIFWKYLRKNYLKKMLSTVHQCGRKCLSTRLKDRYDKEIIPVDT